MNTNPLREGLPPLPERIARLPVDKRGYPVPAFVALVNGEPDHRVADPRYMPRAVRLSLCWICGEPLGAFRTFLLGPMCCVNRVSSEPPMHRECAAFAAAACPFMTKPQMRRREAGLPDDLVDPPGYMELRNPGAMCAWTTKGYKVELHAKGDGTKGLLFFVNEPTAMEWYREGRAATRDEVYDAIATGLPNLKRLADQDGPRACLLLGKQTGELTRLIDQHCPGLAL